jgi:Domain of unknown function (DUF4169)
MAEIVNLKRARKDKARAERENQAATNRRRFGRTKAEKTVDTQTTERAGKALQGKKLEKDTTSS